MSCRGVYVLKLHKWQNELTILRIDHTIRIVSMLHVPERVWRLVVHLAEA